MQDQSVSKEGQISGQGELNFADCIDGLSIGRGGRRLHREPLNLQNREHGCACAR